MTFQLTVLLPLSDALGDGFVKAQAGRGGQGPQNGGQRGAFTLKALVVVLLLLVLSGVRLVTQALAEVLGHGLQLLVLQVVRIRNLGSNRRVVVAQRV